MSSYLSLTRFQLVLVKTLCMLVFASCFYLSPAQAEHRINPQPRIAFINPTVPDEPFWSLMTQLMQSVANDLEIQFDVYYSERNRFKSLELVERLLASEAKPDYLIFHFQAQVAPKILELAEAAGVYSLVINTDTPQAEKNQIGKPREKFQYWLGHISPDDLNSGAELANALINKAISAGKVAQDGKVHMVGLTGTSDNTASLNRVQGLETYVMQRNDVVLHQVVDASWDFEKAKQIFPVLLKRYPEISAVWSASDLMALGAIDALKKTEKQAGKDILFGGIDGIDLGLQAVKSGELSMTISGHFLEGAWAMLFLYAHAQGHDVLKSQGQRLASDMLLVDYAKVDAFLNKLSPAFFEEIDFRAFFENSPSSIGESIHQAPASILKQLQSSE